MKTEASTKTITEVEKISGTFLINCFADMNADGSTTPDLFKSQVLDKPMEIDNVDGKEGELMLSYVGDKVGELNENGELIIELENDDVNKYNKVDENLMYDE